MKSLNILNSKLAAAENNYNSSFNVITKIQKTAEAATDAANSEMVKAKIKRDEYDKKVELMEKKRGFYMRRARKIADFIESLDD